MSTTQTPVTTARPVQPAVPTQQTAPAPVPQQAHVDAVTTHLETAANALRTPQERADRQTDNENQRRADEQRQTDARKGELIEAAAKQQRAINQQRETQLQIGDMAVIDLEKLAPEQHTVAIRRAIQHLHGFGGHKATGRVSEIRHETTGRVLVVQAPQATYEVPEALATRADLFDDGE